MRNLYIIIMVSTYIKMEILVCVWEEGGMALFEREIFYDSESVLVLFLQLLERGVVEYLISRK